VLKNKITIYQFPTAPNNINTISNTIAQLVNTTDCASFRSIDARSFRQSLRGSDRLFPQAKKKKLKETTFTKPTHNAFTTGRHRPVVGHQQHLEDGHKHRESVWHVDE